MGSWSRSHVEVGMVHNRPIGWHKGALVAWVREGGVGELASFIQSKAAALQR